MFCAPGLHNLYDRYTVVINLAAAQGKEGILDVITRIYSEFGFAGFYRSLTAALCYSPLQKSLMFFTFGRLEHAVVQRQLRLGQDNTPSAGALFPRLAVALLTP